MFVNDVSNAGVTTTGVKYPSISFLNIAVTIILYINTDNGCISD